MSQLLFLLSLFLVALGQPARIGWLGGIAGVIGFALFFKSLPSFYSLKKRFLSAWMWFTLVQTIQLSWMTSIEYQGYYILLIYLLVAAAVGCQFGLLTLLVPKEGKIHCSQILLCCAFWTLMEWSRLFILCGFSWNPVGLALSHFSSSLQWANVFGIYGLSFWVILTNLLALNVERLHFQWKPTVSWCCIGLLPHLYGVFHSHYHQMEYEKQSRVVSAAIVQTELLPAERSPHTGKMKEFISPFEQWRAIFAALKKTDIPRWNWIILPEAAVPLQADMTLYRYEDVETILIKEWGAQIVTHFPPLIFPFAEQRFLKNQWMWCVSNLFWAQTLANCYEAEIVAGFDHTDRTSKKNFNSAFYLQPHAELIARYDKRVLLPLAEYLPAEWFRAWTKSYGIFDFFSHGTEAKVFGEKIPFSPSICYEETFPEIMREGRARGAELFINVTNDNYYPHSSLHLQHLFHARLRAVENGIPLIRACNAGVSAAIDSLGKIIAQLPDPAEGEIKILNCHLNTYRYFTLYSFWGDYAIIGVSFLFSIFFFLFPVKFFFHSLRRRKQRG